jgi:hypothetical protein
MHQEVCESGTGHVDSVYPKLYNVKGNITLADISFGLRFCLTGK